MGDKKKPIIVEEDHQIISGGLLKEDELGFTPKDVVRYFVSNIFQRTLSNLLALSSTGVKRLVCTTAGVLKVATIGTGYEDNDTKSGNAPDAYAGIPDFDSVSSRVDIWIWDFPVLIKRSKDGVTWQDEIELNADSFYSFDSSTVKIDIKNKVAASVGRYQITGWS